MKVKSVITALLSMPIFLTSSSSAHAAVCMGAACSSDAPTLPTNTVRYCSSYTDNCYGGSRIRTCNTCNSGYTKTQETTTASGCTNTISFYNCVSSSSGGGDDGDTDTCDGTCTNCISDKTWSTVTTGYQSKTTKTCNTTTCVCSSSTEYRCAAGYYGDISGSIPCRMDLQAGGTICSGCTRCPSSGGVYGTSAAGSTAITSCYIPTSASFSDTTGTWKYTSSCYYTE